MSRLRAAFARMTPRRRRIVAAVIGVAVLVLIYQRSRSAQAQQQAAGDTSGLDNTTLDGTAATGPDTSGLGPFFPDYPTPPIDGTGAGGGAGGTTTSPPATKHHGITGPKGGYRAWLKAHPHATFKERYQMLQRWIAHGWGDTAQLHQRLADMQRYARNHPNTAPSTHGKGSPHPPVNDWPHPGQGTKQPPRWGADPPHRPLAAARVAEGPLSGVARSGSGVHQPASRLRRPLHRPMTETIVRGR